MIDAALIQRLSDQFDAQCADRHAMGEKKYGAVKFMEVNAYEEAMFELVDLANYARYCFIKMALMMHLDNPGRVEPEDDKDTGAQGGVTTGFFNPYRRD